MPLLEKRGLQRIEREASNFTLPAYPGLIVKDSYWRWPQRNLAGNAIDFCMRVLGLSFHEAMRQITGQSWNHHYPLASSPYDLSGVEHRLPGKPPGPYDLSRRSLGEGG
jgi:hypothetical protein